MFSVREILKKEWRSEAEQAERRHVDQRPVACRHSFIHEKLRPDSFYEKEPDRFGNDIDGFLLIEGMCQKPAPLLLPRGQLGVALTQPARRPVRTTLIVDVLHRIHQALDHGLVVKELPGLVHLVELGVRLG